MGNEDHVCTAGMPCVLGTFHGQAWRGLLHREHQGLREIVNPFPCPCQGLAVGDRISFVLRRLLWQQLL